MQKLLLVVLILLIGVGGYMFYNYSQDQGSTAEPATADEQMEDKNEMKDMDDSMDDKEMMDDESEESEDEMADKEDDMEDETDGEKMMDDEMADGEDKMEDGEKMMDDKEMMDDDSAVEVDVEAEVSVDAWASTGSYAPYTADAVANASGKVVLAFFAEWCPSCVAADKDLMANGGDIPSDLTVLKVNYDDSDDLKEKYNITAQHTFVQVDSAGELIKKWRGGERVGEIAAQVQ